MAAQGSGGAYEISQRMTAMVGLACARVHNIRNDKNCLHTHRHALAHKDSNNAWQTQYVFVASVTLLCKDADLCLRSIKTLMNPSPPIRYIYVGIRGLSSKPFAHLNIFVSMKYIRNGHLVSILCV